MPRLRRPGRQRGSASGAETDSRRGADRLRPPSTRWRHAGLHGKSDVGRRPDRRMGLPEIHSPCARRKGHSDPESEVSGVVENQMSSRRRFLRFLAESPLFAAAAAAQENNWPAPTSAKDAINVMDFEAAARKALPPAHFGYLASGVDDDATVRANRAGYQKIQLRPRRVVDVSGHA